MAVRPTAVLVVVLLAAATGNTQDRLLLRGGTVLRTDGSPPIERAAVLVEGDRIVAVAKAGEVDTRPDILELRHVRSYAGEQADIEARLPDTFRRYVRCGITSVVDVGGPDRSFAVRARAREAGIAPAVYCAGRLLTTWLPPAYQDLDDPPFAPVRSPGDCAAEVERQAGLGADLIKVWYIVRRPEDIEGNRPLLDATVQAAAEHGLRVAVDGGGGIVAAGTDAGNIGTLHGPSLFRELELMVEPA